MANTKTFRPIDWSDSAGTGWFTTAYSGNMSKAGTAMFYGRSFASAGWLAVFKNTEKNTVKITTVKGYIGSRQDNVQAKVMCKPLGQTYTKDLASIKVESIYTTNISGNIPKRDKISTITSVALKNPIEVKAGDYFCIGFLGTSIPSGHYFNMASRCLTKTVKNIFYTQDSNTDKTVTWYRSGNANDNTNWKKQYAYIWAEGQVEEAKVETPPVKKPASTTPNPSETKITLSVSTNSIKIPQGSKGTVDISVGFVVKDDKNNKLKAPTWDFTYTNSDKFTVTRNGNTLDIKSTKYDNKALTTEITVTAISRNVSGRTKTVKITVNASAPTIDLLKVSKNTLRPTETSKITCAYSDNAGGIKYSLQEIKDTNDVLVASLNGSVISAGDRTTLGDKTVQLTATTVNGKVTKSINLICTNWSPTDLQVALSSDTIYADSFTGADGSTISITNTSTNGLKVHYNLTKNTILSFSNTKNQDTSNNNAVSTQTLLYTYNSISSDSFDTLKVRLSCDTAIFKNYTITLRAPVTANIKYPLGLQTGETINLPAIARKNSTGKYEVYFSTYPIQISINNSNSASIRVVLKENQTSLKIGNAFYNTILNGNCWMRPETAPKTYTATKLPKELLLKYTLKVEQYIGNNRYQSVFDKTFSIKYTIYKDYSSYEALTTTAADFDLISLKDQGQVLTAEKAEKTLSLARTILNQYKPITLTEIKPDNLVVNSQETVVSALIGLYNLISTLNKNSHSLVVMPLHRTKLAHGQYVMADDSAATLADGRANTIKSNYLDLSKPTASPFREIVKAVYNLTGPVEHYKIVYKENNKTYTISKVEDTSTGMLYSIDTLYL